MSTGTQNFTVKAGRTKLVTINYRDPRTEEPVDVTGATINMRVAKSFGRSPVLTKSTADDITLPNPTQGEILVTFNPEDTEGMEGDFLWEAKITFADSSVDSIDGRMTIEPSLVP